MAQKLVESLSADISHLAIVNLVDKFSAKLISIRPTEISAEELDKKLRSRALPIIALVCAEEIFVDLRTVWEDEIGEIARVLIECCQP